MGTEALRPPCETLNPKTLNYRMSHNLNSFKGVVEGIVQRTTMGFIRGILGV